MGTSIGAKCSSCAYDAGTILIGYGMTRGRLAWPVLCSQCHRITTANHEATPLRCEVCASTSVTSVTVKPVWSGSGEVIKQARLESGLYITNGPYLCPVCDRLELRFGEPEIQVMWD